MSAASPHSRSGTSTTGLVVFAGAAHVGAIGDLLQRLRYPDAVLQTGGPSEAMAWCAAHSAVEVLLVDIDGDAHPLASLLKLAAQTGPCCRIIALGTRQDVDFYRQLLQAGIFDYLLTPLRLDLLAETLTRADADQRLDQAGGARAGRTVACVGTAGGLGNSTLVAALGQWLALHRQTPTVLVDFDRRKADLPLLLGLQADAGLAHLLEAPSIDPRLLQRSLVAGNATAGNATASRLQLLAQRPAAETALDPERVLELGGALSQLFSLSLWDLPAHRPNGSDEVLAHAEYRIVLTELGVQAARSTQRLLAEIGDESAGQRLLLLTSPLRQSGRPMFEPAQFEDFVGRAIDLQLPHAGNALSSSLLSGPVNTTGAPAYAAAIEQLGHLLLGQPTSSAAASSLTARIGRWLRRPADSAAHA
jgi:pilus assembly protein CpaE